MKKLILLFFILSSLRPVYAQLEGTTQGITFTGPVTKKAITFTIYLPPNYDVNTTKEYPVVYHLHGLNGTHGGNQIKTVPDAFESAKVSGNWDEAIIVFPDGYRNSMWADSYDKAKPAETNLIKEIIPYVDNNYRTLADKEHRLMQGFSMGGFGALKFYTKYPELFCKVVVYDGALHNWATLTSTRADIATEIFNDDSTMFNTQASPWKFLEQNPSTFSHDTLIYIVVGALKQYNRSMSSHLDALGIPHIYVETVCPHAVGCMLDEEGENVAIFYSECLNAGPTNTATVTNGTGSGELVDVYPNPASNVLMISANVAVKEVQIFDITGRLAKSGELNSRYAALDISELNKGVYFVNISTANNALQIIKMIKQ